jgi:hypothetical protein
MPGTTFGIFSNWFWGWAQLVSIAAFPTAHPLSLIWWRFETWILQLGFYQSRILRNARAWIRLRSTLAPVVSRRT